MASNPKSRRRRKIKRPSKKRRLNASSSKRSAKRGHTRSSKRRSARPRRGKTTRTTVRSVKVVTNPKRKRRRRKAANRPAARRAASRFTLALSPTAARLFARVARLTHSRRRQMLRGLRRHPSGGMYVAVPEWHGSREQAKRFADRVRLVLAYAAGRRRARLSSASVPRVVAVP